MSSSSTAIWARSSRCRMIILRATDSRRARNSASLRIGARRRPASRPSRRRCRLASIRVEPVDAGDLGARLAAAGLADPHHDLGRIVGGRAGLLTPAAPAPATAPLALALAVGGVRRRRCRPRPSSAPSDRRIVVVLGRPGLAIGGVLASAPPTAATPAAPAPPPAASPSSAAESSSVGEPPRSAAWSAGASSAGASSSAHRPVRRGSLDLLDRGLRRLGHLGQQLVGRLLVGDGHPWRRRSFARRTGAGGSGLGLSGVSRLACFRTLGGRLLGGRLARRPLGRRLLGGWRLELVGGASWVASSSIAGASGADDGGPAGRLAARRRRGAGGGVASAADAVCSWMVVWSVSGSLSSTSTPQLRVRARSRSRSGGVPGRRKLTEPMGWSRLSRGQARSPSHSTARLSR